MRLPLHRWKLGRDAALRGRRFVAVRYYDIELDEFHYGLIEHGIVIPSYFETVRSTIPAAWRPTQHSRRFAWLCDGQKRVWEAQA